MPMFHNIPAKCEARTWTMFAEIGSEEHPLAVISWIVRAGGHAFWDAEFRIVRIAAFGDTIPADETYWIVKTDSWFCGDPAHARYGKPTAAGDCAIRYFYPVDPDTFNSRWRRIPNA